MTFIVHKTEAGRALATLSESSGEGKERVFAVLTRAFDVLYTLLLSVTALGIEGEHVVESSGRYQSSQSSQSSGGSFESSRQEKQPE